MFVQAVYTYYIHFFFVFSELNTCLKDEFLRSFSAAEHVSLPPSPPKKKKKKKRKKEKER